MSNVNPFINDEFSIAIQSKFVSMKDLKACSIVEVYPYRFLTTALD
jgi:hypothetical protein